MLSSNVNWGLPISFADIHYAIWLKPYSYLSKDLCSWFSCYFWRMLDSFCLGFLDYLWLFHSLNAFHFRTSKAHNCLICEQKHQVWACILLGRMWQIFWYQNYLGLQKKIVFALSATPFSVDETLHVAYQKYKTKRIFFFFGKYQIYFISWVENIRIFTTRAVHSWKFWCFQHTPWNIFGIHLKKVNILYIFLPFRKHNLVSKQIVHKLLG